MTMRVAMLSAALMTTAALAEEPLETEYLMSEYCRIDRGIAPGAALSSVDRWAISQCKGNLAEMAATVCLPNGAEVTDAVSDCIDRFLRQMKPDPWVASTPRQ